MCCCWEPGGGSGEEEREKATKAMALRGDISLVLLGDASIKGREQLIVAGAVTLVLGREGW